MKNILDEIDNNKEFQEIIQPIINNDIVQQMKHYRQHCNTTCFLHCYTAAYYCYKICKKRNLDYKSATRAAMLHDLFLYDWRQPQPSLQGPHAFAHPIVACTNANKIFNLNQKEQDIIKKHMWPLTPALPKYRESYVLTVVDKYCAINETIRSFLTKKKRNKQ